MLVLLGIVGSIWWYARAGTPIAPETTVEPKLPNPRVSATRLPLTARIHTIAPDLARAVAAVGAFDDGHRQDLNDLPVSVRALLDQARFLLATTPRCVGPGLPMVLPDGSEVHVGADPGRVSGDVAPGLIPAGSPAERELARAVDGKLVARTWSNTARAPVPTRGDHIKEILEPDAWMAVPYDPALVAGQSFELTNRSLGDYVLRIEADDYGSVRLNGGLVVPGRFYLMDGTMTISSDVPVGVTIRPLGVVHGYYDQPVRPPSANG